MHNNCAWFLHYLCLSREGFSTTLDKTVKSLLKRLILHRGSQKFVSRIGQSLISPFPGQHYFDIKQEVTHRKFNVCTNSPNFVLEWRAGNPKLLLELDIRYLGSRLMLFIMIFKSDESPLRWGVFLVNTITQLLRIFGLMLIISSEYKRPLSGVNVYDISLVLCCTRLIIPKNANKRERLSVPYFNVRRFLHWGGMVIHVSNLSSSILSSASYKKQKRHDSDVSLRLDSSALV